jgi:hypothetical protein
MSGDISLVDGKLNLGIDAIFPGANFRQRVAAAFDATMPGKVAFPDGAVHDHEGRPCLRESPGMQRRYKPGFSRLLPEAKLVS